MRKISQRHLRKELKLKQLLYTHPSQVWFASIDGSMLLYLITAVYRIVLGLPSVGTNHTWAPISL